MIIASLLVLLVLSAVTAGLFYHRMKLYQRETRSTQEALNELEKQAADTSSKVEGMSAELGQLEDRLKQLKEEEQRLIKENEQLEQALKKEKEHSSGLKSALDTAQREISDLRQLRDSLQAKIDELTGLLGSKEAEIRELNTKVRNLKDQIKEYKERVDQLVTLELENHRLKTRLKRLSQKLEETKKIAEDNRIAWIVTQKQLEMAEDRIHMLLKGKPRPGHKAHDPDVILAEILSRQAKEKTGEGNT